MKPQTHLVPVVLCGGAGARLWPLSRKQHPKQFAPLLGLGGSDSDGDTLFRRTMDRVARLDSRHSIVVCGAAHRFFVAAGLRESERRDCTIISEPHQRGTAPAAALAALEARRQFDDALLLLMPSDHIIADVEAFAAAVDAAAKVAAAEETIVLFGIPPRGVETEYGYIQLQQPWPGDAGAVLEVAAFHEKPDRDTAADYLARGDVCWNSGLFLLRASTYLNAVARFEPGILESCERALANHGDAAGFIEPHAECFAACRAISIDHAVIERADNLTVMAADMGWSDVGNWKRLADADVFTADANDNRMRGDVVCRDAARNIVHGDGGRLVSILGVDDCIVVDTADALLVADAERASDIADLVDDLRAQQRAEVDAPRRVHRPWGYYERIDHGDHFQVKRIVVNPGQSLSLQLHHRRSEHWTIVAGEARVTVGDKVFALTANQSTHIPAATRHRIENPSDEPVVFIEVQYGDYLGEDDIVRFDDRYGRGRAGNE